MRWAGSSEGVWGVETQAQIAKGLFFAVTRLKGSRNPKLEDFPNAADHLKQYDLAKPGSKEEKEV